MAFKLLPTIWLILLATGPVLVKSASILYISTTVSGSHHIWDKTLAMGLAAQNHKITYLTHMPEKETSNFKPILLEGVVEKIFPNYDLGDTLHYGSIKITEVFFDWMNATCYYDLHTDGVRKLVNYAQNGGQFDAIIMDITTGQCLYPLIELFNSPPVIATSPYGLDSYLTFPFGIDLNIAYNPFSYLPYTDQMTFYERVNNFYHAMYVNYKRQYVYLPAQQSMAQQYFGKITPLDQIERKFSLLLVNADPHLDYPQPVPPAVIQVGGLQMRPAEALSKDLQKYLDDSKHGAILFALGSNMRIDNIGEEQIQILLKAFGQLKQNVLWKYESNLTNIPPNVLIQNRLPVNYILGHPNCKCYLTHGGGMNTQLAIYHGVSVVGIPFIADQHGNMRKIVWRKLGLKIDSNNITVTNIVEALKEVIDNPLYKQSVMTVSQHYRDQPQNALERAIFWVEYVLKHGGAEHLRIASRDMYFYEIYLLDMWLLIAIGFYIIYKIIERLTKITIFGNKRRTNTHKTKKH